MSEVLKRFVVDGGELDLSKDQLSSSDIHVCTVLLLREIGLADGEFESDEINRVVERAGSAFALDSSQVGYLLEICQQLAKSPEKISSIISRLASDATLDQRIEILSLLWLVALADKELTFDESTYAAKARNLLNLSMEQALNARARAEQINSC